MKRCEWCGGDPLYQQYHDEQWGVPVTNDRELFEMLNLEGMQAGLSWITVLKKRATINEAFHAFDPEKCVQMTEQDLAVCRENPGIIRNRLKCAAVVSNARAYLDLREQGVSLASLCWQVTDGKVVTNHWQKLSECPATTPAAEILSKTLKQHGFKFVGPTICYAFMQAVGIVNDHVVDCFRHGECQALAADVVGRLA